MFILNKHIQAAKKVIVLKNKDRVKHENKHTLQIKLLMWLTFG